MKQSIYVKSKTTTSRDDCPISIRKFGLVQSTLLWVNVVRYWKRKT